MRKKRQVAVQVVKGQLKHQKGPIEYDKRAEVRDYTRTSPYKYNRRLIIDGSSQRHKNHLVDAFIAIFVNHLCDRPVGRWRFPAARKACLRHSPRLVVDVRWLLYKSW